MSSSFQQQQQESTPRAPRPCAAGCSFFGSPETLGLCSACYKMHCGTVNGEPAAKSAAAAAAVRSAAAASPAGAAAASSTVAKHAAAPGGPTAASSTKAKPAAAPTGATVASSTAAKPKNAAAPAGVTNPSSTAAKPAGAAAASRSGAAAAPAWATAVSSTAGNPAAGGVTFLPAMWVKPRAFAGASVSVVLPAAPEAAAPAAKKKAEPTRCAACYKKVGLLGFVCKCNKTFCGTHRHAEEHGCSFDFKGAGRDAIARNNPLVKGDKLAGKI